MDLVLLPEHFVIWYLYFLRVRVCPPISAIPSLTGTCKSTISLTNCNKDLLRLIVAPVTLVNNVKALISARSKTKAKYLKWPMAITNFAGIIFWHWINYVYSIFSFIIVNNCWETYFLVYKNSMLVW